MTDKKGIKELDEVEDYILSAIREIRFGSVEVTVHNAQIVQVEKSNKRRFDAGKPA